MGSAGSTGSLLARLAGTLEAEAPGAAAFLSSAPSPGPASSHTAHIFFWQIGHHAPVTTRRSQTGSYLVWQQQRLQKGQSGWGELGDFSPLPALILVTSVPSEQWHQVDPCSGVGVTQLQAATGVKH